MATKEDRVFGRPFQMFLGGFYSVGLGFVCDFCANNHIFNGLDNQNMIACSIICKVIGVGTFLYYLTNRSKFDDLFINLKIGYHDRYPMLKYKKRGKNSILYHFRIPAGVCLKDFKDKKESFEDFLGHKVDIYYTYKEIVIEEFITTEKTMYPYSVFRGKGNMIIVIGYDRNDNLITCDLSKGEPHMLIAGETGGGKSTSLRAIITNLLLTSDVKLFLIDLKNGVEFRLFEKCENVLGFARNIGTATLLLQQLSAEVDRRYELFYQYDVKDIVDYNKKMKDDPLDYRLLVIDEFADLQNDKNIKAVLADLGRKARACGIHMLLSTQRPDAKILDGEIKANITTVLGLKTKNDINSRIIIDENGLEKLRGYGHGIFKRGAKSHYIQAPNLDYDNAKKLVEPFYREETKEQDITSKSNKERSNGDSYVLDDDYDMGFLDNL